MLSFALLMKKLISFFHSYHNLFSSDVFFLLTNFENYDIILAEMTENFGLVSISFFIYICSASNEEAFLLFKFLFPILAKSERNVKKKLKKHK